MLQRYHRHMQTSIILFLSLANVGFGYCGEIAPPTGAGAVGLCYFLLITTQTPTLVRKEDRKSPIISNSNLRITPCPIAFSNSDDPVEKMIGQSRYALLLRRQVAGTLSEEHFRLALDAFQQGMSPVPEGDVLVGGCSVFTGDDSGNPDAAASSTGILVHVEPFFLDRYPITNRQYYEFVAGGGYHEMTLWDKKIWPAVLDMVDQTGLPGPRSWRNGCYLQDEENLPVVGISWYEAEACAHWLCKRLPTDAEWVKAASWPISIDATTLVHRRYPWGDAMDHTCANVWESGHNRIVPVGAFAEGASVGGVFQLIGNV
jgi:gamma-glutamyl hercynylcysteine S-oxide synthase